ncbi:hypothetical protein ACET3X_006107 [Alternaria dauci]|uniref:Uncharacterized protein n=1 Tax=Alternaria dauci TaxID=48095 RepID=A0ABR3UIN1_9PLEO
MVQAKDIMLRKLGVPIPSDEADTRDFDREVLADMVQARMNVLADEKQRLDRIEMESRDQVAEINRLKETIATQLNKDYIPGVSTSFDALLHDKQKEIDNLRKAIRGGNFGEANHMLHQEKDAELSKLRPLSGEVETLKQALIEAKKEAARVEEENRVNGVAEQRRLNEARVNAGKERSDEISALRARQVARVAALESRLQERDEELDTLKNKIAGLNLQLRKAERALASSHKTQQPQSSDRPTIDEPRQCFNDPSSKQNTSTETEDYLRRSLDEKDQEYRELQQNFVVLAQQHREKVGELEELKARLANDKERCENEKSLLRQQIIELEKSPEEVTQVHGSQSSTVASPGTNELQFGSTASESSSKANETSYAQLEKQLVDSKNSYEAMVSVETDLRAQVDSLSKVIQAKEAREHELLNQISTSKEELEAKLAHAQGLSKQVATATLQRSTALEETTKFKKQLEEAISEGRADRAKLEKSNTDLQAQCDQLRQEGIREISSRDSQIQKLQLDAATGKQTIRDLEQRLSALKVENENQDQVIRMLKKELQAEKDRYLIDVNNLKNDVDHAQREAEKATNGRKDDVRLSREREARAIDEESSEIKKLQEKVDFYKMENNDLRENGKEAWKNILKRKNEELQKKESDLSYANSRIRHWHKLYNLFHRRYEGLERNQAFKEGEVTYAEARAGLFMGSDSNISDAMEKCAKFIEDLEAEVGRLKEEVEKLRKYDEKVVEEEMDMDEKTIE